MRSDRVPYGPTFIYKGKTLNGPTFIYKGKTLNVVFSKAKFSENNFPKISPFSKIRYGKFLTGTLSVQKRRFQVVLGRIENFRFSTSQISVELF